VLGIPDTDRGKPPSSSTARIEKKLDKFFAEVQAGLREGSVVTTEDVAHTIETADVWAEFRRELVDVGINLSAAEENHDFILERLRAALAQGTLEERATPCDSAGPEPKDTIVKRTLSVSPTDSGYGSNASSSPRGSVSSSISAANQAFEEELRRHRSEWQPGVGAGIGTVQPGSLAGIIHVASASPATLSQPKVKKRTGPVGRVKKWFVNEKAIIQAASDGDAERVAELISLGVDVNARDQWG